MGEPIKERDNEVVKIGNSKGFRVKSSYLEMAGMKETGTEVTEAVYYGKHGVYIVHHLPGEQPEIEDLPEEAIQKLKEQNGFENSE